MTSRPFSVATGASLCLAGLLLIGINAVLFPMLPQGAFAELAASDVFFIRQILASVTALLMLFGVIGLHLVQMHRSGVFGAISFVLAVVGAVVLFSVEWNQAFTVRDFALQAPATLEAVEDAEGLTPFDIGALIASSLFFLGWLLFAVSLFFAKVFSRVGAALVAIGFFVAPILSTAQVAGPVAVVGSSIVIGVGWLLLGVSLVRPGLGSPT